MTPPAFFRALEMVSQIDQIWGISDFHGLSRRLRSWPLYAKCPNRHLRSIDGAFVVAASKIADFYIFKMFSLNSLVGTAMLSTYLYGMILKVSVKMFPSGSNLDTQKRIL